jgi:hypothetical protein
LKNIFSPLDLLRKTTSLETFLLCSAALANLTSLLPTCLAVFASSGILPVLLTHRAAASTSVYIQVGFEAKENRREV